jgi:hypothetical protein
VSVAGARLQERWVAAVGGDFRAVDPRGVTPVKDLAELSRWPAEAELIRGQGSAWRVQADDWRLGVVPRAPAGSPLVNVLGAEQAAAVVDGRHWLHQATYTLTCEGGADLYVQLPDDARAVGVALDGTPLLVRHTGQQSLWLPLPAGLGPHTLEVRWVFPPGQESLDRPRLQRPSLRGIGVPAVLWTVHVPPGYRLARAAAEPGPEPVSAARLDLERADVQLRLSRLLAEHSRDRAGQSAEGPLRAARQRFAAYARRAEAELLAPGQSPDRLHDGQSLSEWLRELRKENERLARLHGIRQEEGGSRKEEPSGLVLLPPAGFLPGGERGTPVYWRTQGNDRPPSVQVVPLASLRTQEALAATEVLGVLLLGIWILGHLPRLALWLRRLWPEQLLVLALVGWHVLGPSLVGVCLAALALGGRLLTLLWWLSRRREAESRGQDQVSQASA